MCSFFALTLPCPENSNGSITFHTQAQVTSRTGAIGKVFQNLGVGNYHFQLTDTILQCTKYIEIVLNPSIDFDAFFTTNPELPNVFDEDSSTVQLIPNFIDSSFVYYWDFGDGQFSSEISPIHHFEEGNYFVKLRIRDMYGNCVVEYFKNCSIDYFPKISIPNVFTPNHDGVNDAFIVQSDHVLKYDVVIFDRWGENIFSNNGISNNYWNGLDNHGKECAVGTYFYTIQWHFKNNTLLKKSGNVTLLR